MAPKSKPLAEWSIGELHDRQTALTAERLRVLAEAREVQAELDRRAEEREARRVLEARELGQVNRPPTQQVF